MNRPAFLDRFRRDTAPAVDAAANPASELALIGAAKRRAEARAASRTFHRQMRADLGLPPVPEFDDR